MSLSNNVRRFAVALSFPGEHRRLVRNVASRLAEELEKSRVFFDEWYEAELRGTDADLKLQRIYRDNAQLVVPFFSAHYKKMWCQIEWRAMRVVLAERREEDAVVPVHIDDTQIEGWESIDLGIRKGRKTGRQIADAILDVFRLRRWSGKQIEGGLSHVAGRIGPLQLVHADADPPPHRPLLRALEHSMTDGELRDSLNAPAVLAALSDEKGLELVRNFDPLWIITGIRLTDEYYVGVRTSAGQRDWQRDFAQVITPTLVGVARSLQRSADAQALVIRLCDTLATRLRLRLVWPKDTDEFNDLTNAIYGSCLVAKELESDAALVAVKAITVIGPK